MVLADTSLTSSFMNQYGPYAFGIVAVVILVLLGFYVMVRGVIPLLDILLKIQKEQTSQTDNLRAAAISHERTTQNLATLSEVIKLGSGTIQRPN